MFEFKISAKDLSNGSICLPTEYQKAVLAIGNFDGLHLGHQFILNQAKEIAIQDELQNLPYGTISFSPHPRAFFSKTNFFRLTDDATRAKLFEQLGLNLSAIIDFDAQFAALSAEEFVKLMLVKALNISHIIIGNDFCFGKNRQGNASFLKLMGEKYGFGVTILDQLQSQNKIISSSQIRQALGVGDVKTAGRLLGRDWHIAGKVMRGEQLGRQIGFPTANVNTAGGCALKFGTYAGSIEIDGQIYQGAVNYGTRPTVGGDAPRIEIYIFDFDRDIYGQQVNIFLHKFIRNDEKFSALEPLIAAIKGDVAQIKQYFVKNPKQMLKIQKLN